MHKSNIINSPKVTIFVEYEINAVPTNYEDALEQYLLEHVWGVNNHAEEDIRLINKYWDINGEKNTVRYQFGDFYEAEYRIGEVGDLIEQALDSWDFYKQRYLD